MTLPQDPKKREEYRVNLRAASKRRWAEPGEREKNITTQKIIQNKPEVRARSKAAAEKYWNDPENWAKRKLSANTFPIRFLSCYGLQTFRDFVNCACKLYNLSYKEASTRIRAVLYEHRISRLDIVLFLFYATEGKDIAHCAFKLNIPPGIMYQRLIGIRNIFPDVFQRMCYIPQVEYMWGLYSLFEDEEIPMDETDVKKQF